MKALKLKVHQQTVSYKKPYAQKVEDTYPLPPYSTILGLLHYIIGAKEYVGQSLRISVQGEADGTGEVYNNSFFYKKLSTRDNASQPIYNNLLYDVNLIIHIAGDEDLLNKIYDNFFNKTLTLGKANDLVRVDEISFVNLTEINTGDIDEDEDEYDILKHNAYIPKSSGINLQGIAYNLNKRYEVFNELRVWKEKVLVNYVQANQMIDSGIYYKDDSKDKDLAFLY